MISGCTAPLSRSRRLRTFPFRLEPSGDVSPFVGRIRAEDLSPAGQPQVDDDRSQATRVDMPRIAQAKSNMGRV
jgi:hypothetical protein